ncbi:DOPA 4,5-dioxygenase [Grifola frondosa]|uniref:DOPA 4,5-dioxygenase n=1 Tax=Grifola frondosa TaxID=5627 RepID=A0A1C7MFA4_GRIFR|nr:DOPA 4,5-dioxygenase [Grifola frondosa]
MHELVVAQLAARAGWKRHYRHFEECSNTVSLPRLSDRNSPSLILEKLLTIDMSPQTDLKEVADSEIKEWHFHIYFHKWNADEHQAALELRDAVLRLRRDGAFVAVPLFRVNTDPIGPHPVGSYEIWCPSESFASVYSYLCLNRGDLSVLIHPLTREQRKDHEIRQTWLGSSFQLNLSMSPVNSVDLPLQYPSLKLGYSALPSKISLEERKRIGSQVERVLRDEKEAAKAPSD